jgi:hypothetical protein
MQCTNFVKKSRMTGCESSYVGVTRTSISLVFRMNTDAYRSAVTLASFMFDLEGGEEDEEDEEDEDELSGSGRSILSLGGSVDGIWGSETPSPIPWSVRVEGGRGVDVALVMCVTGCGGVLKRN